MADMPQNWQLGTRLTVVVGHTGCGKTEFSVNLALSMARLGLPVTLADLDVVNPYFRGRERKTLLTQTGVELIATSQACVDADVPVMPPELNGLLEDPRRWGVLDIGGGPTGARVLARYQPRLTAADMRVWLVLNACRPQTGDVDGAVASLAELSRSMGLTVTGLVNNTHLCGDTQPEDIYTGAELVHAVARTTGIPVVCHCVPHALISRVTGLTAPVFPLSLVMKKPWESGAETEGEENEGHSGI